MRERPILLTAPPEKATTSVELGAVSHACVVVVAAARVAAGSSLALALPFELRTALPRVQWARRAS